jgi:hypothetical protein
MDITILLAGVAVAFVGLLFGFRVAARRFAARQRRLGRWDEYGPLEETEEPPVSGKYGFMDERLEVIGKWKGRVLSRRRPHEPPDRR